MIADLLPLPTPLRPGSIEINKTQKSESKKTLRLQSLHKNINATPENTVDKIEAQPNELFTFNELQSAWAEFANDHKDKPAEYQLLKRNFSFEYPTITLSIVNALEESLLNNFQRELMTFLHKKLKNETIQLKLLLRQSDPTAAIYTAKEKFEHLTKKNPSLAKWKERLELDWDF